MFFSKHPAAVIGTVLVLGGCSFVDETLFPSLSGEPAPATTTAVPPPPASADGVVVAETGVGGVGNTAVPVSVGLTAFSETGTVVGERVLRLSGDLGRLQSSIGLHTGELDQLRAGSVADAQRYNGLVGDIQSRLQVGTTPGNPILVRQWNDAQSTLDKIGTDVGRMNGLANAVADDSALAAFILESTRATFGLTGAVDEDHRQLAVLEDEVNRTVVQIDRLLNELNEDVARQSNFVGRERSNLTVLSLAVKNGELFGRSLQNRAFASAVPVPAPPQLSGVASERPLVVIRFDRERVDYQQPLFTALSEALERRPQANFELVAITPDRGTPAQVALNASASRRNAEDVLRTLSEMGLPRDRVGVSATSSAEALTSEVHVYVR